MQDKRNVLIKTLSDEDNYIEDSKLGKMINLLSLTPEQEEKLAMLFLELNIPMDIIDSLIDSMLLKFDLAKFYEYTQCRDIYVNDHLGKVTHLPSLFDFPELVSWLMKLVWKTQPPSGEGEAALAILFGNARKPSNYEAGDVIIGRRLVEVKGRGARLIGQRGYGDGPSVGMNMALELQTLARDVNVNVEVPTDPLKYNFSKRGSTWLVETIATQIINKSKSQVTHPVIAAIIARSLHLLYKESTYDEIYAWVLPTINVVGVIDKELFIKQFFSFSFNYYHCIEKFDIFVIINGDNMLAIPPHLFSQYIDKINFGMPSWGHKAGTQGKAFSITLK